MASVTPVVPASAAERLSARGPAPRVDFLGLGVQKAATTWLYRILAAHPGIFMARAEDKDLRFFSAYYDRGHLWYERHFAAAGSRRCGEFSTSYFYSKDAPERVFRYHPGIRLLLSLRDPVERLVSHHIHEIRVGRVRGDLSLARALESNPSYVEQSMYYTQLSRWLEWFPRSSFHIVIFEEMFRDPERTARELYAFVGVDEAFVPDGLGEKVNERRVPRSLLIERGIRRLSAALRSIGGGPIVESLKSRRAARRLSTRSDLDIGLDDSLAATLRAKFAVENARLAAVLGRDLSVWPSWTGTREDA